jgi:predicted RNA-binding protein YlqC (UPF0109 family)
VSAFDDEFGLFGDEEKSGEEERKSTLGARRIASDEAAHDDIEPEDERPRRGPRGDRRDRSGGGGAASGAQGGGDGDRRPRREYGGDRGARKTADPVVAQQRAMDLLGFLARKLVAKPDSVLVEEVDTDKGPVVELVVEHEDLGKVIGRSGRVAQALRTLVRASAEGRISIDIISFEDEVVEAEAEHAGSSTSSGQANVADAEDAEPAPVNSQVTDAVALDAGEREGYADELDEQQREAASDDAVSGSGRTKAGTAAKTSRAKSAGVKKSAGAKSGAKKSGAAKSGRSKAKADASADSGEAAE